MRSLSLFALLVSLAASAAPTDGTPYLVGTVEKPHGHVVLPNPATNPAFTTLSFAGQGRGEFVITHLRIRVEGAPLPSDDMGAGAVAPYGFVEIFSNGRPRRVLSIEFDVEGDLDSLTVTGEDDGKVIVPGGFSAGN